jgi:hypothetical protein
LPHPAPAGCGTLPLAPDFTNVTSSTRESIGHEG